MPETGLEDLNVDPIEAIETMKIIGITEESFADGVEASKVSDILSFFQGKGDKSFIINKLLIGKPTVDKIHHLWSYVTNRNDLSQLESSLEKKADEIKTINELRERIQLKRRELDFFES